MPVKKMRQFSTSLGLRLMLVAVVAGVAAPQAVCAQDASTTPAAKPVTFLGTVQTLNGHAVSVKSDAGVTMQITVQDGARLLRIEPGQKTLAGASPFSLTDLQTGDRVMARGAAGADSSSITATMLVAIKSADIAQKQDREREEWQKNGVGGLVKTVDPAASTVTISLGAGGNRVEVIHTTPATIVRRYAPGSIKFDQAVAGTFDQIKAGDQVRARGVKDADGTTLEAAEIVSGRFENIAGAILSVDAVASTMMVSDSATKKTVTVAITPESELKKLDPTVAQRVAQRLSGGAKKPDGSPAGPAVSGAHTEAGSPTEQDHGTTGQAHGPMGSAPGSGAAPDFQQVLGRAPAVALKDLRKGNMVIVVGSQGLSADAVTAITVVAGVEPMLQASTSGSQAMLSAWNLGGGEGGGGEGAQ